MPPSIDSLDLPPFRPRFPWWSADLQTIAVLLGTSATDLAPHRSERLGLCLADRSGDILRQGLSELGYAVSDTTVVPDSVEAR